MTTRFCAVSTVAGVPPGGPESFRPPPSRCPGRCWTATPTWTAGPRPCPAPVGARGCRPQPGWAPRVRVINSDNGPMTTWVSGADYRVVRLLGREGEAEDVAQTVFLRAFERFAELSASPAAAHTVNAIQWTPMMSVCNWRGRFASM